MVITDVSLPSIVFHKQPAETMIEEGMTSHVLDDGMRAEILNFFFFVQKTTVPNQAGGELQGPSRKYTCEEDKTLRGHNQNPVLFDDMADIFHVNECPHVIDICVDVATNLL